jgi:hypothetical protein
MCPECFGTLALMIAGATSTGGVTALVVKLLRTKRSAAKLFAAPKTIFASPKTIFAVRQTKEEKSHHEHYPSRAS